MGVVNLAELAELIAEREELERERQCLLDRLRNPGAFDDVRSRLRDFSTRLANFVGRLRTTLQE